MTLTVMKFGGTSVQDAAALRRLIGVVRGHPGHLVLVVSALAGVTDRLSAFADRPDPPEGLALKAALLERHLGIVRELVDPERQAALSVRLEQRFAALIEPMGRDAILALGELASSDLIAEVLASSGVAATWVDARDVVLTDDHAGQAKPDVAAIRAAAQARISPLLERARVPVVGGFVGSSQGVTTTLGRGGSDYTAALLGAALDAVEVQIWTDVDGVYSGDPRTVSRPALIPQLSFNEAYELARFGAKVLHWGTIEPAAAKGIPVRVLNAAKPGLQEGTTITARPTDDAGESRPDRHRFAVGVAHQHGVTVADLRPGGVAGCVRFLQSAIDWLDRHGRSLNVVSLSPARLVVTGGAAPVAALVDALTPLARATVTPDASVITLVGAGVAAHPAAWNVVHEEVARGRIGAVFAAQSGDALVCVTSGAGADRLCTDLHSRLPLAELPASHRVVAQ